MFITHSNQAVVEPNLEYESLLGVPNDVESNDFIIDLYPFDRDPLKCLFVGRSLIYLLFVRSSRMKGAVIIAPEVQYFQDSKAVLAELARKLGLHHSTIYRLRRLPGAPESYSATEQWRTFALSNLTSTPDTIVRVGR